MIVFGDIVCRNARRYPDKEGVVCFDSGRTFTYAKFNQRVNQLANGLLGMGLKKGDRIAVLLKNCAEYLESYSACAKAGVVITPILFRLSYSEIAYILEHSGANVFLIGAEFISLIDDIKKNLPVHQQKKIRYISVGKDKDVDDMVNYEELLRSSSDDEPEVRIDSEDIFILAYTSGTTGKPKGAMITHGHIIQDCINHTVERRIPRNNVTLAPAPVSHIGVTSPTFAGMYAGGKIIMASFEPQQVVNIIEKYHVTHVELFPGLLYPILELPNIEQHDFSSMQSFLYGASPIAVDRLKQAMNLFKCNFFQLFGMTEAGPTIVSLLNDAHIIDGPEKITRRLSAAGRETLNVEVKVVDASGKEIPRDFQAIGEVIVNVQSGVVMKGYWNDPESTASAIKDGWYYTGDIAKMDEDNYIYIVDRAKDIIISGGENISSAEVESVLFAHPSVLEAGVIGVPDQRWGEAVKGFVVLREDLIITAKELIDFCKEHLASYKCPKSIEFISSLPRNAAGKLLKKDIRKPYWEGHSRKI